MAVRDNRAAAPILTLAGETAAAPAKSNEAPREKSKFWGNIGIHIDGEFIPLGGVSFDDIPEPVVPNPTANNAEYRKTQERKRRLYLKVKERFLAMEPGTAEDVKLAVQFRRIKEEPVSVDMADPILDEIENIEF